ncbi:restriction endonuclease subunit S [Providencia hangzhouensis]|uniref:Restriction endonuclease subunit S n=1 Tax=Providencia rettgeri TaxID=587 RepID=A0AAW6UQ24_PRORE|nr:MULTISPECIES: restriction endonuclease subunit S [Providencia]MDI9094698.1 restriction endonuclease subunit S [Providencia rettgeri]MDT2035867.1 restriction endonuclease subunit S [Providencia rettgeri]QIF67563.1 restriction endonuclease subunit S [Providencia sp. 1709051003]WOB94875.1 restriction endonuclease subunit S [Providencia sp. PROV099]
MAKIFPNDWVSTKLEIVVEILDAMRIPVNNNERQSRIEGKLASELFPYYGATGEVGKIDGYLFNEELVALGEDGVPFFDHLKTKAYLLTGKTWVNNHAHVLKGWPNGLNNKLLLHYLNQFDYQGYVNGGTRLKLTQANMRTIPVPLPPLAEQKSIVDKLNTLLTKVEQTKTRLERISELLNTFRQSVLSAAVSGKLVSVDNPITVTVGEIATDIRYGTSKKCDYNGGQTPVIRIPNISDRKLNTSDLKYADFTEKELKTLALKAGDILVIRSNGSLDLVAKPALVEQKYEGFLYAGYLIRIRCNENKILPSFLLNIMSSRVVRDVIEIGSRSTSGVNNINSKELAALKFILPSIEEQTEIVQYVEKLFDFADSIEQKTNVALNRVNNLTQSILAKAFRGELTADWRAANPDLISGENSAESLLEKIKAERKSLKQEKKARERKNI